MESRDMAKKLGFMRRAMGRMASPMVRMMIRKPLRSMLGMLAVTKEEEYSCDDAYELLDLLADLRLRGEETSRYLPLVELHLELCQNCREEFEAMLEAMRADV